MKLDVFVKYECYNEEKIGQLLSDRNITSSFKVKILSMTLAHSKTKEIGRAHYLRLAHRKKDKSFLTQEVSQQLGKINSLGISSILPGKVLQLAVHNSFCISFKFILAKPYISKDDEEFYIIDNPVKKDKIFKVPLISGSSWKGNLRWTAGRLLELEKDSKRRRKIRLQINKLFGHENEAEKRYFDMLLSENEKKAFEAELKRFINRDGLRRARLHFYPSFFEQIDLEVINPHDRRTKTGRNPIYIECVPKGTPGTFTLIYVPFDLIGYPEKEQKQEVKEDLFLIVSSLKQMFLTYGFSAKKTSGFGVIEPEFSEQGQFKMVGLPESVLQNQEGFSNFQQLEAIINKVCAWLEATNER